MRSSVLIFCSGLSACHAGVTELTGPLEPLAMPGPKASDSPAVPASTNESTDKRGLTNLANGKIPAHGYGHLSVSGRLCSIRACACLAFTSR